MGIKRAKDSRDKEIIFVPKMVSAKKETIFMRAGEGRGISWEVGRVLSPQGHLPSACR